MVGHTRRKWKTKAIAGCAALGITAGMSGTPLQAQDRPGSILERMQDEVATVARQSRAAIVTIEDSRAVAADYANSALHKTDLQDQIARLLIDKKAVDADFEQKRRLFNAGTLPLLELNQPRREQERLEARLSYLRQRLANVGREDAATQRKAELQERTTELQIEQTSLASRLKLLQAQVNAGVAAPELNETQRQLAQTELSLKTAQQQLSSETVTGAALRQNEVTPNSLRSAMTYRYDVTAAILQSSSPRSGSGFSIGDGLIVTTADVAQGMNNPVVTTDDGRQARATLLAVDTRLNIALLRLSANLNLPALKLGDSANVMPGHFAITMGNQIGQSNSVALSTISALRTQGLTSATHYYPELLQIDGTVSAGTSGAPVLNARGEVIGMLAATPAADAAASTQNTSGFLPARSYNYVLPPMQSLLDKQHRLSLSYEPLRSLQLRPASPAQAAPDARKIQPPRPLPPSGSATPALPINPAAPPTASPLLVAPPTTWKLSDTAVFGLTAVSPQTPLMYSLYDPKTRAMQTMTEAQAAKIKALSSMFYNPQTRAWTDETGRVLSILGSPANVDMLQTLSDAFVAPTPAPATPASTSSGFAIPVNAMKSVLDTLKTGKNVVHAWLGMNLEDVDNARAENGIVRLDKQVKIAGIYDRSPASKAGMKEPGDILVGLDDLPVHTGNDVRSAILLRFKPGQNITAHLLRAGKPLDVPLMLEALPANVPPLLTAPKNTLNAK